MTTLPHFAPLLVNEETKEPFLRLSYPHSNIVLTPPRMTDAESIVSIMNDERVYRWLQGPPFPYLVEHARQWLEGTSKGAENVIQEFQEHPGELVGGCPVRILRELNNDGTEVFLGDCSITRYGWPEIEDNRIVERMVKENDARVAGDPEIVWSIGDYLAPSHHGKGIMTAALKTLIEEWMIPRMGAKKIKSTVFTGNAGSLRVFEKNGFVLEKTLQDWIAVPKSKGGGNIGLHIVSCQL